MSHQMAGEPQRSGTLDAEGRFEAVDVGLAALLGVSATSLVGSRSPFRIPAAAPEVWDSTALEVAGAPVPVVYSLRRRRGDFRWSASVTPTPGLAVHEPAVREVGVAAHRVTESGDLDAVVRELTRSASRAMGLTAAVIVLMDPGSGNPVFAGGLLTQRHQLAAMEVCRASGAPMTIWHAFHDERIVVEREWRQLVLTDDRLSAIRPFAVQASLNAYAAVPLRVRGEVVGAFAGLVIAPERIGAETVAHWDRLAHEMGTALHAVDASRQARAKAADRERLRLNEDLHATVSQDLFALRLLAAEVTLRADVGHDARVADGMAKLRSLVDHTVEDVRGLITQRSQEVEGTPLSERLRMIAARTFRSTDTRVDIACPSMWDDLSLDLTEDVSRVVHEALHNVRKHAGASRVSVDLSADENDEDLLVITVMDDGAPFGAASRAGGFGLDGIEKLAVERGGSMTVRETPTKALVVRMVGEFEPEWTFVTRGRSDAAHDTSTPQ